MTKLLLSPGQPLAEARAQVRRSRQAGPVPTGDATTASSKGWVATAVGSATPHTKGAWVQVVAATTYDIYGLLVLNTVITRTSSANSSTLLDIGVGAGGSEVVVVPNLAMGYRTQIYYPYRVPVFIPAGSRLAVRCQGAEVSKSVSPMIVPFTRTFSPTRPATTVDALNADSATSRGTTVTNSGVANTLGAWTQLVAATAMPYTGLMLGCQGAGATASTAGNGLINIGIGASGSEVTKIPNLNLFYASTSAIDWADAGAWLIDVPVGSRIAARWQAASTANGVDAIVYGIR